MLVGCLLECLPGNGHLHVNNLMLMFSTVFALLLSSDEQYCDQNICENSMRDSELEGGWTNC